MDAAVAVLVVLAFLVWYSHRAQTAEPELTICHVCGDAVYAPRGVLVRCPSCRKLFVP